MDTSSPTKLLSKKQLKTMNKENIIDYAVTIGENFSKLSDSLLNPETGVIVKLQAQLAVSQSVNKLLMKKIVDIERQSNHNAQYSRKESAEIHGMPLDIPDNRLEQKVISLLNEIKPADEAVYTAVDIEACHRLKKKDHVIIKFAHRKRMRAVMNRRGQLKDDVIKKRLQISGEYFLMN